MPSVSMLQSVRSRIANAMLARLAKRAKNRLYPFYAQPNGGHGTHVPALKECIRSLYEISHSPLLIVEYGIGIYSTKTIIDELKKLPRTGTTGPHTLYSLESEKDWIEKVAQSLRVPEQLCLHNYIWTENQDDSSWKSHSEKLKCLLGQRIPDLVFLDSNPRESRTIGLKAFKDSSKIVMVHDCDYFPHNKVWGVEESKIQYAPKSRFRYGTMKRENLGYRDYSDQFKYWVEFFPHEPGFASGPPTLIGSNTLNVVSLLKTKLDRDGICIYSQP